MNEEALSRALDLSGAFNSVAVALAPGASEPEVKAHLDDVLRPYGGLGAIVRADQTSHLALSTKLAQIAVQARVVPAIFLGVAAFLLNTVLARLIGTQRSVIATLRAFGFGRATIVAHYLQLAAVIALLGAALGLAGSAWMGVAIIGQYRKYYRFPSLDFAFQAEIVVLGVAVTLGASLAGVLGAVLRASALSPAEAMRPEAPKTFRPVLVERLIGPFLAPRSRMVLRQLGRRPGRAALGVVGITFSVAIVMQLLTYLT